MSGTGRRGAPTHRLIGQPVATTIPTLTNIRWRYCDRTDECLAAQLGKSFLRLGICKASDWSGSAVDFVARGFNRYCHNHGVSETKRVWDGELRITDCQFCSDNSHPEPGDVQANPDDQCLYLVGEFHAAASIPIGATLALLEEEERTLPGIFFNLFTENLWKWMRVYDYRDAVEQAEYYIEGADEEDLKDSFYPRVKGKIPKCLQDIPKASKGSSARMIARCLSSLHNPKADELCRELLTMNGCGKKFEHSWPGQLAKQVPGLEEYLSDCDGCGPGCVLTWHENDEIEACFDDEASTMGQNGPLEPSTMTMIPMKLSPQELDQSVCRVLSYTGAMLQSLASAAKIVEIIREIDDEYVRDHRIQSGIPLEPRSAGVRQE